MGLISSLGEFFGKLLKEILPGILRLGQKPRDVEMSGYDCDLAEDIDRSIEEDLGYLSGDQFRDDED